MKSMCQKIRNLLFHTFFPAVLAVLILPMMAFAQEGTCQVSLPVSVQVVGSWIPEGLEYHLVLEGTGQVPMPENCEITVKNKGTAAFGPIAFGQVGNYSYQISQKAGNDSRVAYDDRVYLVTVQVIQDGKGGLKANVLAYQEHSDDKTSAVMFTNTYTEPSGGNGGGGRGDDGSGNGGGSGGPQMTKPQVPAEIVEEAVPLEALPEAASEEILPLPVNPLPMSPLPKTGDRSLPVWLPVILLAASGGVILWLIRRKKKPK